MSKVRAGFAAILLGVLLSFAAPAVTAVAAPVPASSVLAGSVSRPGGLPVAAQQEPGPGPGPVIDPQENERANAQKTKSKIIVGVLVVVLLGIVVFGRHQRGKSRKKSDDQAKGK